MPDVTKLLNAINEREGRASSDLLPLIYQELKQVARQQMGNERTDHTLQATALVHEAYLRLVEGGQTSWDGRRHFIAAAAEAMRRILIEHARQKKALKYGGAYSRVELDGDLSPISARCVEPDELLALDEALNHLAIEDPAIAELVKLLYFAGLNLDEAAAALGISRTTVHRRWVFARAWLYDAINGKPTP